MYISNIPIDWKLTVISQQQMITINNSDAKIQKLILNNGDLCMYIYQASTAVMKSHDIVW